MDSQIVLSSMNKHLTLKSNARLRATCKLARDYIYNDKAKKQRMYRIFKRLWIDRINIVRMLLQTDIIWLKDDYTFPEYSDIHNHIHGQFIKKYIYKKYHNVISDFINHCLAHSYFIEPEHIMAHCESYTNYHPLLGILFGLCDAELDLVLINN